MKKIGILTYHRSINYGALMQAYSLSERLARELPDYKVEIIDYMSEAADKLYHPSFWKFIGLAYRQKGVRNKAVFIKQALLCLYKKTLNRREYNLNRIFDEQLKSLKLSNEYIVTDDVDQFFLKIKDQYEVVIVGSDAVFNWQIRKFPNPYFLAGDIGAKRFSYAASSYGQEFTTLTEFQKEYISKAWNDFDYLGVRDSATEEFVKFVTDKKIPHHNCDPTVFLDLKSIPVEDEKIKEIFIKAGVDFSKPLIGIMAQDWLGKIVRDILGDKYQIIAVFKDNPYADFYLENLTPFQWSKVFRYFSVTFTHFFHGNLLSLKNGTPTIAIENRSSYNMAHNSKIRDLMARINLSDFCYYRDEVDFQKKEIIRAVEDRIENRSVYENRIYEGLEKEAHSFDDFIETLKETLQYKKE